MKNYIFDLANPISILDFLIRLKLACNAKRINEGAALSTIPSFVAERVSFSPNIRIVQSDGTKRNATMLSFNGATFQESCLTPCSKVERHLPKRCDNDEIIDEANAAIVRFTQLTSTATSQYGETLFANAIRFGNVYNQRTLSDTSIAGVYEFICYGHRYYRSSPPTRPEWRSFTGKVPLGTTKWVMQENSGISQTGHTKTSTTPFVEKKRRQLCWLGINHLKDCAPKWAAVAINVSHHLQ